ncbi:MAG TPA: SDR family oxidoreductase [Candidatus Hydrogenedentes bacterium]|jgi:short-subunit dehydrogenase|nr:MAG: putative oxidoreductase [Candidatus Hydrogenedentes bacterium ADurb.Bin170]HNZ49166.1 SDR family oxidoreductase [Candidatus Hydrogenedentota bacterium]HOD96279.1 SDR family oxidoreductase [Candidatus Hydrogenedentota bacterium]HOH42017.1 SDR family oxidoreductase [Candidatus Hydrogenedentota bacterium]HOM49604.1 SDR family oxidoreductase [Candidatus Hydrogenedentota bacterium]
MKKRFQDKVALITGASSGIGEALARQLAAEGAGLCLFARRADRLQALQSELEASGAQVAVYAGDVTVPSDLEGAVALALERFGRLDLVVANAGIGVTSPFSRLTTEDYRHQFEVNFFGVLHTLFASLEALKASQGQAVLVGSVAGLAGTPGSSPYNASKFAVVGLAESLYYDLGKEGIAVTLVNPGFVESEIRLLDNRGARTGRGDPVPSWLVMPASKAASVILKAVYKKKAVVVVTFHGVVLSWLKRFCPALIRLLLRQGSYRKERKK